MWREQEVKVTDEEKEKKKKKQLLAKLLLEGLAQMLKLRLIYQDWVAFSPWKDNKEQH